MSGHIPTAEVSAAKAKAHLLQYLREAERGRVTVISKRGARIAALVPIEQFLRTQESAELFAHSIDAMLTRARRASRKSRK